MYSDSARRYSTSHATPRGRGLTGALLFGVLQFGIGFACIYYGYAHTPAGLEATRQFWQAATR